jgi:hypothetical protein
MTYCCRAMPFRLKNTGATYQWMVNLGVIIFGSVRFL